MTTLFFLTSLLFGWLAWNLYHPVYRPQGLAVVSFLCGWLTGELALHHILWQLALVLIFAWAGAIDGFYGALALFICVTAWFAMAWFYIQGNDARREMESALSGSLGQGYQAGIREEFRAQFPSGPNPERLKHPFARIDPALEVIKDVAFGSHGLTLDIYRSHDEKQDKPVLLQIHGGAWTEKMGSKNEQGLPLMSHMATRGWISVAISYRLSPVATFPEHIIDCKEALVWIRDHIAGYGGDPDFVVVTGGSAGGHLTALMALTANDPEFQPGFEDRDTSVKGAVPFYGVYDFTNEHKLQKHDAQRKFFESSIMKLPFDGHEEEYRRASPLFHIHEEAPPFLIIHGDRDTLVPVEEARIFASKLREVSKQPVVYAEITGAQHAFDIFPSIRSENVKHGVEKFLAFLLSREESG